VASGLDSIVLGEAQIEAQVKTAWEQARTVGATGRFLNSIFEKALAVCERVHSETAIGKLAVSIPLATLDLAQQIFGSLVGRKVLLLGAGKLSELSARHLVEAGAGPVMVIDQSSTRAKEVAERLGGTAATLADRWSCLLRADIAVSATGCPHVILTREEAERIAGERNRVALVIMDIAMPRDVDPEVRRVDGILLYDLEGLERSVGGNAAERRIAAEEAEKIVAAEAQAFRGKLQAESVVPTAVALRRRLEEICRQELEFFVEERGPFSREQVQSLHAVTAHVIRKIAGSLVRELRELPEKQEQEQMTAAITRLFRLESPEGALAGARSERREDERRQGRAAVINY
jgi:glutamyl-tRNA reductase